MQTEKFKTAVGKYPTGVTIISTNYGNKLYGFTANSFNSVSLEPALISFCLNKKSHSFDTFLNSDSFAVSILSSAQENVANCFASSDINKFENIDFIISEIGLPLVTNALSSIECKRYKNIECGDHYIFIGRVLMVEINHSQECQDPLVYYKKSYRSLI